MTDETLPDQPVENNSENNRKQDGSHRHRRRTRVRKRIRIKKKSNPKRKIKKILERLIWIIIIAGFITTLVILVKTLDIKDENIKKKKSKTSFNSNTLVIPKIS